LGGVWAELEHKYVEKMYPPGAETTSLMSFSFVGFHVKYMLICPLVRVLIGLGELIITSPLTENENVAVFPIAKSLTIAPPISTLISPEASTNQRSFTLSRARMERTKDVRGKNHGNLTVPVIIEHNILCTGGGCRLCLCIKIASTPPN
jgi:hypothetical protein